MSEEHSLSDRTFIEDQKTIQRLSRQFKPTGKRTNLDTELLLDIETEQLWEKYEFDLEDQQHYALGLRKYPYPPIVRTIEIALTTEHMDEVEGAAGLLHDLELYSEQEFRTLLLDTIEQYWPDISPERYEILYERAELYDVTNKRAINGKHYDEIERDAGLFMEEARRAKTLLSKIRSTKT